MTHRTHTPVRPELSPRTLVAAYAAGAFPMPDADRPSRLLWFSPDPRGLLPLDDRFHVPRRLRRTIRRRRLVRTIDRAFPAVMRCCADRAEGTWISDEFLAAYGRLHALGLAHSLEVWPPGQAPAVPIGGVYGVALGGAFFAESMFHRAADAGNIALVHLIEHLRRRGFVVCDAQWLTPHLRRFGGFEVPRTEYLSMLAEALARRADFGGPGEDQPSPRR